MTPKAHILILACLYWYVWRPLRYLWIAVILALAVYGAIKMVQ